MEKKYWMALMEHGAFTRDDHYIFRVFFTGQKNGSGATLKGSFIEAEDYEESRKKLHKLVDEYIDHKIHGLEIEKFIVEDKKKKEAYRASPKVSDSSINELTIGEFVDKAPKKKGDDNGLLDLEGLV